MNELISQAQATIMDIGFKILGAIILWVVGQWLIRFVTNLATRVLEAKKMDRTLMIYLSVALGILLKVILVVAILGFFGVETTSFAALIAAGGVAIGMAWSGMLAHFAAGVFLVTLRPFKVGDFISAGGITGTVRDIGLFSTTIDTPDNIRTMIGNNKIFSDTIQNCSANPHLRVDLTAQIAENVDHKDAIRLLKERLVQIPNVLSTPAPDVEILSFNASGPLLTVRPYCAQPHYWQVYFDTNRTIREAFIEAAYPTPETRIVFVGPSPATKQEK